MRATVAMVLGLASCGDNRAAPVAPADAAINLNCGPRSGTALRLREVARGLEQPVHVAAPRGDARVFVVERTGRIRVIEHGVLREEPYLDLTDRVVSTGEEQGLLGLAFHPQFGRTHKLYVHYTAIGTGYTQLSELTAERDRVWPATERKLLLPPREAGNHNGGMIEFGPDGLLYVGEGDGGGGNDQYENAQDPEQRLAKILRIDVDRGDPYAIPTDNPWAAGGGVPEMFAWGLRNPWRFAIDRVTGDVFIGDVGQAAFEEIDVIPGGTSGQNFGWPVFEGPSCFVADPGGDAGCDRPQDYVAPLLAYDRRATQQCSVVAGAVYRGTCMVDHVGTVFWGDYCTGEVNTFVYAEGAATQQRSITAELDPSGLLRGKLTSFGIDGFGEIHVTSLDGRVYRVELE